MRRATSPLGLPRKRTWGLLGEAIEMNLELVGTEQPIGPFKAGVVARDGDRLVIIENQLDATDHKHLGQLLVYAAGPQCSCSRLGRQTGALLAPRLPWCDHVVGTARQGGRLPPDQSGSAV